MSLCIRFIKLLSDRIVANVHVGHYYFIGVDSELQKLLGTIPHRTGLFFHALCITVVRDVLGKEIEIGVV